MDLPKYKILYIGKFGENNTETHIADALDDLGNNVTRFSINKDIHAAIKSSEDYDFALFAKLPHEWRNFLNKCKCKTICWTFDLYPFLFRTLEDVSLKADIVISTGGVPDTEIVRQGIPKSHKINIPRNYQYDVAFVGSIYSDERAWLHNYLKELYGDRYIRIGGKNEIRGIELNTFLSTVKIVVGDSEPKDNYWSNRIYEITGRAGFLIHPEVKGLEYPATFKRGDQRDLRETIEYYLENETEREQLREELFNNCPTYHERVKEFLCKISQ